MFTFDQFCRTAKLKTINNEDTWCYGFNQSWHIVENNDVFSVCGEEFSTLQEAEVCLYNMYCDNERLLEGY